MLRVSTSYRLDAETGAAWVLRLEGRLQGDWVNQLRRQWDRLRSHDDAVRVCIELDEVELVDEEGRLLLAELHAAGVDVAGEVGEKRDGTDQALRDSALPTRPRS
jgi:hypothetical protein